MLDTTDGDFPNRARILYDGTRVTTIEEMPVDITKEHGYSTHLLVLPCITVGFLVATFVALAVN